MPAHAPAGSAPSHAFGRAIPLPDAMTLASLAFEVLHAAEQQVGADVLRQLGTTQSLAGDMIASLREAASNATSWDALLRVVDPQALRTDVLRAGLRHHLTRRLASAGDRTLAPLLAP